LCQEALVERAPVDPDPHRFVVRQRHLDDGAEVLIVPLTTDVSGIDAVLSQRSGAVGILGEEQVTVVVEVPDDGNREAEPIEPLQDGGHRRRRGFIVDRDSYQFAAGARQLCHLPHGPRHIGRVGVGHRLDDDRMIGPDPNTTDGGSDGTTASG
jgi:hypothetical protein